MKFSMPGIGKKGPKPGKVYPKRIIANSGKLRMPSAKHSMGLGKLRIK